MPTAERGPRRLLVGFAVAVMAGALAFTVWLVAQPLFDRLGTIADARTVAARTGIWSDTLRLAVDFPLFGSGFGTLAEVYPRNQSVYAGQRVIHAHNDWVQLLAEGGLAGMVAFLLHSFTDFSAHIPANAPRFTVLAALTLKTLSGRVLAAPAGIG